MKPCHLLPCLLPITPLIQTQHRFSMAFAAARRLISVVVAVAVAVTVGFLLQRVLQWRMLPWLAGILTAFITFTTFITPAQAAEPACPASVTGQPSVGLVLSGGGARGYAHLGVLKVLEDNRIPIDCIAATSMGAVVGGLYASGMNAHEMEQRLSGINLSDIAFDTSERAALPQGQREDERLYVSSLSLGFGAKGIKLPAGLVQGNQLQALLQDWTRSVAEIHAFNQLPIPYRAIATDLQTGEKVVLDHGSLAQAIRASMAMPGLYAPAQVDGRTLVDGGLVSNLPVDTAHQMGANVVIAVDISSPLRPLTDLASPTSVMQQMIGILIKQNVAHQLSLLSPRDTLIVPELGSLGFTDFSQPNEAIAAGEAAARAMLPQLKHLALTPVQYAQYRAMHTQPSTPPMRISSVEITSHGAVPEKHLRHALHVKPGDIYDAKAIDKDLLALTTAGTVESASQQLVRSGDDYRLLIDTRDKNWGPNFLLFGLGLSSSSSDEGGFRLHLGYRRPWLTESGLEGRIDSTLGNNLINVHAELRQPLSDSLGYYVAPYVEFQQRYADLYDNDTNQKVTQLKMPTERAGLDFGLPLSHLGNFRIGLAYAHGSAASQYNLGADRLLNYSGHMVSARARLVIDQLDDPLFPRKGYFTELRGEQSLFASKTELRDAQSSVSSRSGYTEVYGKGMVATSFGRHSLNASIEGGTDFGAPNPTNLLNFTLGGFQHLSAYAADQLSGSSMAYAQVTYMNRLATFSSQPIRALYAGVSLEAGNVWNQITLDGNSSFKRGVTVFTAATSAFGPLYIGVAFAPGGRYNFYFQLGRTY